ncbi:unnamed protein product [Mesocestoides corti]|uniref:Uncharacterized protein n=1 Tax=Mesocestoides corti TaxID=53468 RepID=A0A158QTN2_MESCO|nr:unnamed protein product [Mesocestoides corti]
MDKSPKSQSPGLLQATSAAASSQPPDYLGQLDPMVLDQQLRELTRLLQIFHPLLASIPWSGNSRISDSDVSNSSDVKASSKNLEEQEIKMNCGVSQICCFAPFFAISSRTRVRRFGGDGGGGGGGGDDDGDDSTERLHILQDELTRLREVIDRKSLLSAYTPSPLSRSAAAASNHNHSASTSPGSLQHVGLSDIGYPDSGRCYWPNCSHTATSPSGVTAYPACFVSRVCVLFTCALPATFRTCTPPHACPVAFQGRAELRRQRRRRLKVTRAYDSALV